MPNNLSYNIKKLEIETKAGIFNISDKFQSLILYDSIFSPTITGSITIKDSVGISKNFYFDGTETLIVDLEKRDCTQTFKKIFILYNKGSDIRIGDSTEQYTLKFASREYLLSMKQRVFSVFKNTYSEIVKKILTEELDVESQAINITPSYGIRDVVFSNKSPFACIVECAKKAIDQYDSATFMFYENKYGFNFTSLATIANKSPIFSYNFDPKNFSGSRGDSLYGITRFSVIKQYDITDQIKNGMYGVNAIGYNFLQRSISINSLTLDSLIKGKKLNSGSISVNQTSFISDDESPRNFPMMCYPVGPGQFKGGASKLISPYDLNKSDNSEKYFSQRKAQLGKYFITRVRLVVPGNFDLVSGSIIDIKIPIGAMKSSEINVDEQLSGNYMVVAVKHNINIQGHETVFEISKDSTIKNTIYQAKEDYYDEYEYSPHTTNIYESEEQ